MRDFEEWVGGQVTSTYHDWLNEKREKLADLAFQGRFDKALEIIESERNPNGWRLRAPEEFDSRPPSGWTILHQAAMLPSAQLSHIERLITLGAHRNLRTLDTNETAQDIAIRCSRSREIISALKPVYVREFDPQTIANFQKGVDEVVLSRVESLIKEHRMRIPPIEVLLELPSLHIWFPVPGFYGGFHIEMLENNTIQMESFCRVAGGSEQTHVVHPDGKWEITQSGGW